MNKYAVIVIPIYNPNEKITEDFLKDLTKKFSNIIFVNDGCSSEYDEFFEKLEKKYPVIKHSVNLGKGRGLKNSINYILNNYPEYSIIVAADCDGQHSVEDIEKCYEEAKNNPDSLILGCRDFEQSDVPFKSRYGNKITRNILKKFVGQGVSDTQTGLRAMSLDVAKKLIDVLGERYEYETNVLISCKRLNIPIREVTIKTIYIDNNGTSHFNPIKDSVRIYKFFGKYLLVSLFAYLIENILFGRLLQIDMNMYIAIPLFMLISKIISNVIIYSLNKHVVIIDSIVALILSSIVLMFYIPISGNYILIKVIVDFILILYSIFIHNYKK